MDERVVAGLAETIQALRAELGLALEAGSNEMLRFELEKVKLEVMLAIMRTGGSDARLRFGVLSFGAGGQVGKEATHRVTLVLSPMIAVANGTVMPARISGHSDEEPR
jgi:hypothetical protein